MVSPCAVPVRYRGGVALPAIRRLAYENEPMPPISPAQDSHALTVGADVVSQAFLIGVGVVLVVLEYWRGNKVKALETAQKKEEKAARRAVKEARLAEIDDRISDLAVRIDALEAAALAHERSGVKGLLNSLAAAVAAERAQPPAPSPTDAVVLPTRSWAAYFGTFRPWLGLSAHPIPEGGSPAPMPPPPPPPPVEPAEQPADGTDVSCAVDSSPPPIRVQDPEGRAWPVRREARLPRFVSGDSDTRRDNPVIALDHKTAKDSASQTI